MSPLIHGTVGWLLGHRLPRRRDRALMALIAVAPDVDGLGLLVSEDLYLAWHHRLAHGALAAGVAAIVGAALLPTPVQGASSSRLPPLRGALRGALLGLAAFHSHIVMDLVGSGPGWPILYGWPFVDTEWLPSWQWNLASWQNTLFGLAAVLAALAVALSSSARTPAELFSPRADDAVVAALRARFGRPPRDPTP